MVELVLRFIFACLENYVKTNLNILLCDLAIISEHPHTWEHRLYLDIMGKNYTKNQKQWDGTEVLSIMCAATYLL